MCVPNCHNNHAASHGPHRNHRESKTTLHHQARQGYEHRNPYTAISEALLPTRTPFPPALVASGLKAISHPQEKRPALPQCCWRGGAPAAAPQLFCRERTGKDWGPSLSKAVVRDLVDCQDCGYYFRPVVLCMG